MKKRVLALVMALALCVGLLPLTAAAGGKETVVIKKVVYTDNGNGTASAAITFTYTGSKITYIDPMIGKSEGTYEWDLDTNEALNLPEGWALKKNEDGSYTLIANPLRFTMSQGEMPPAGSEAWVGVDVSTRDGDNYSSGSDQLKITVPGKGQTVEVERGGGSGGDTCDHVGTGREYESPGKGYSFHYVVCAKCKAEVSKEDHVFGDPVKGNGDVAQYTRTCTKCGYEETVNCTHNGTFTYKDPDDKTHIKVCDICGKYIPEDHRLDNYTYENEQNHFRTCMNCLKRFTEPHTWKRKWPRYEKDGFSYRFYFTQTCKQCGAVAEGYVTGNPFGYRIISEWADVDEYSTLNWMFSRINSQGGMTKDEFEQFMADRYDIDAFRAGWITVVGPLTSLITAMGGRADVNSMNYIQTCMDYSFLDGKPVKLEVIQTTANNAKNTNQNTNQNVNRNINSNIVQNSLLRANGNLSLFQQSVQVNNLRQMTNGATPEYPFDEDNAQWKDLSDKYTLAYLPYNTIQTLEDGEHSITMIFAGKGENGEEILCPYTVRFEVYSVGEDTVPVKNIRNRRPEGEMYRSGASAFLTVNPREAEYTGSAIEPNATVTAYSRVYKGGAYVIESDTLDEGEYSLTVYRTDNDATIPVKEIKEVGEYVVVATPVEGSEWKGEAWATFTVTPVESTPSYIGGGAETVYKITVAEAEGGKVTASRATAPKGAKVTLTVVPDKGFELDELKVVDAKGNEITVTDGAFTMPASDVTVTATFKELPKERPFTDVKESDWFYDAVYYCYDNGYFKGTGTTVFDPQGTMTRAMFATVLWRVAGEPAAAGANPFTDVKAGQRYTDAVLWAAGEGIIEGYGDGRFGTDDPITREQIVTLLWRFSGKPAGSGDLRRFSDAGQISDWAKEAMAWAVGAGIIQGKGGGILDPGAKATRAEVAQIIANYDSLK